MFLPLIVIFIFNFFISYSSADEIVEYGVSAKGLGMGNAYTGSAQGHDAIFYNPAAFAQLKGVQFRLMGLQLGINDLNAYSKYKNIFSSSSNLSNSLNSLYGDPAWVRGDYQLSWSFGPFIAGGFSRANAGFALTNPALPYLDANYFAEYGVFMGTGMEIVPEYIDAGFIVKRITRVAGGGDLPASAFASLDSQTIESLAKRSGVAYGVDFGTKLKMPGKVWKPSIAFAWQDIGSTKFSFSPSSPAPATIQDRMNVALSLEGDWGLVKFRPTVEYKNVNSKTSIQTAKKLHAGAELELPAVTLRGGFNQGYLTYGASFDFWLFQVDAAVYSVELGEYVGQQEDKRYMIQLTMDFGIDDVSGEWFSFSKTRKNRRGLKQRR